MAYGRKRFRRFRKRGAYSRRRRSGSGFRFTRRHKRFGRLTQLKVRSLVINDSAFVKLRFTYDSGATLSSTATPITAPAFAYYSNNLYRPAGDSNFQPTGFDQWKAFYRQYQVLAMSIKVTAVNLSPNIPFQLSVVPVGPAPGQTNYPSWFTPTMPPWSIRSYLYSKTVWSTNDTDRSRVFIKHYMTTKKMLGRPQMNLDATIKPINEPVDQGDIGGNWWFAWVIQRVPGLSNGDTSVTIPVSVAVKYYVKFSDRITNIFDVLTEDEPTPEAPSNGEGAVLNNDDSV